MTMDAESLKTELHMLHQRIEKTLDEYREHAKLGKCDAAREHMLSVGHTVTIADRRRVLEIERRLSLLQTS